MSLGLKIDVIVLILIVVISIPVILFFNVKPLVSSFFFFIIPSVYLLFRKPRNLKRILVGALLIGSVFGFIFDFLAILNKGWSEPVTQLVLPYKLLGIVPIDHLIWYFFWTFL